MNPGTSLPDLVRRIQHDAAGKKDFIVPAATLTLDRDDGGTYSILAEDERFGMKDLVHSNLAQFLDVPGGYYNRLKDTHADIHLRLINDLLGRSEGNRMLRTLHGDARFLASDRYRRLDYLELAAATFPPILDPNSGLEVKSAEITDTKFYLQVVAPRVTREIRVGDPVQAGFILSNSEVGLGALTLRSMVYRLRCTNGMIVPEYSTSHRHIGARQGLGDFQFDHLSEEAQRASDQALFLGLRDTLAYVTSEEGFEEVAKGLREAADTPLDKPEESVEGLRRIGNLREEESMLVLRNLFGEGDLTRWGLSNAVTALANEHPDYDRAVELEHLGGQIMRMPDKEFHGLASQPKKKAA